MPESCAKGKRWSADRRKRAITLHFDAKHSYSVVAKKVGVPLPTVKRWLKNEKANRAAKAAAAAKGQKWERRRTSATPCRAEAIRRFLNAIGKRSRLQCSNTRAGHTARDV
jgi:transposase-like protein